MRATVHMILWPSTREFRLPASGTRSMLFRFGSTDPIGAVAVSRQGDDFVPGGTYPEVELEFWWDGAPRIVEQGTGFTVWYGSDVGEGEVTGIL